jgi:hypothetical protein
MAAFMERALAQIRYVLHAPLFEIHERTPEEPRVFHRGFVCLWRLNI